VTAGTADRCATTISVGLPVRDRAVTVVGSTGAALSAVTALLRAGAQVTVVAATPTPYLSELAARADVTLLRRAYRTADIDSAALVFAHSGDPATDADIAEDAARRGLFCISGGDHPHQPARRGRVIIVGGGPGDPGLLTVAGRDAIASADVVVTDRLAPVAVLHELASHAQVIDVAKVPGGRRTEQWDINRMLIEHAQAGRTVVRLKGGDGFVFGRGGEEADECINAGIEVVVIPGVSSAIAAPGSAMIPVTHRGLTQGFTVISGHVPPDHPDSTIDYGALAQANTTIVLMMAVANLDAIAATLIAAGMPAGTPAAVVADGSMRSQREIRADLATIADAARAARIGPPATTIIGAVAGFVPGAVRADALSQDGSSRANPAAAAAPISGATTGTQE